MPIKTWSLKSDDEIRQLLDNTSPGEPVFVIVARDRLAPLAVRAWAGLAEAAGVAPEKIKGALACAEDMETWGFDNPTKLPD